MSELPILYSFRRCPYAMRARMAMAYAGLSFEIREVLLKDKPEQMLALSPKGTVPVLLVDQKVIDESLDVMRFALARHDPQGWLDVSEETLAWVTRCEDEFKPRLDQYKYHDRHPGQQVDYRLQCTPFLMELNQVLGGSQGPYLGGQELCFVDVALFPFVRQFAHVDKPWFDQQPWEHLRVWLAELLESDLFRQTMHKYPQWRPGDDPVVFTPSH